jgi:hypothetical protein
MGVTLRKEHRMRVHEKRVLRRIFGPKTDEMVRGRRKLHKDELHNFYFSPNIIRMIQLGRMKGARNVARMGEKQNSYRILMGRP